MNAGRSGITLGGLYLTIAVILGVGTFFSLGNNHKADGSVKRCISLVADKGGGVSNPPSVLMYSAGKGLLWPLSFWDEVINQHHDFTDWLTTNYDPFAGKACG